MLTTDIRYQLLIGFNRGTAVTVGRHSFKPMADGNVAYDPGPGGWPTSYSAFDAALRAARLVEIHDGMGIPPVFQSVKPRRPS